MNITVLFQEGSRLTTIKYGTFEGCPQLKTVVIPKNVTKIRFDAFLNCYSLENLIFEDGSKISTIEYNAFRNCMALKTITLPTSLKTIGSSNGSGYMCTKSRTIGGVYYEFASNGVCLSK